MKINKLYLNKLIKEELNKVLSEVESDEQRQQVNVNKVTSEMERGIMMAKEVIPKLAALKEKQDKEQYFENIPKSHIYEDYKTIEEFRSVLTNVGSSLSTVLMAKFYDGSTWLGQGYLTPEQREKLMFPILKQFKDFFGGEATKIVIDVFKDKKEVPDPVYRRSVNAIEDALLKKAGYNDIEIKLFRSWMDEPGLRASREAAIALNKRWRRMAKAQDRRSRSTKDPYD